MQNFSRVFDILGQRKERFGVTCKINYSRITKKAKENEYHKSQACDWEGHVKGSQVAGKLLSPKQGAAYKNTFLYTNSLSWTIIFEIFFLVFVLHLTTKCKRNNRKFRKTIYQFTLSANI